MIRKLTISSIIILVLSILIAVLAFEFNKIADDFGGVEGLYVSMTGEISRNIGHFDQSGFGAPFPASLVLIILYSFSAVLFAGSVCLAVSAMRKSSAEIVRKYGIVREKETVGRRSFVIVDFSDNTRRRLTIEPPLAVTQGDRGVMGYKDDQLVEFRRA